MTVMASVLVWLIAPVPCRGEFAKSSAVENITAMLGKFDHASVDSQRVIGGRIVSELQRASHAPAWSRRPYDSNLPIDSIRAMVWYRASVYFGRVNRQHLSLHYALKALPVLERSNNLTLYSYCISALSMAYYYYSDFASSLSVLRKCIEVDRSNKNYEGMALDYNNFAAIYDGVGRSKEALGYIQDALRYRSSVEDTFIVSSIYRTASLIHLHLKDYDKALHFANLSYEIEMKRGNTIIAASRSILRANVLTEMGQYHKAEADLLAAIRQCKAFGDDMFLHNAYQQLGDICRKNGKLSMARYYYGLCAAYYHKEHDYQGELLAQQGLYEALRQSDPASAMKHLERSSELKDSIYNSQFEDRLSEYNAIFDNDKLRAAEESQRSLIIFSLLCISLLLLLVTVMAVVIRMRRRKLLMHKEQEEMKDRFFTNISHEYRTPLTIIQMASQAVLDAGIRDIVAIHHHANVIQRQASSLLNLVNGILDLARLQSHAPRRLKWKRGDLVPFVNMVVDSFSEMARKKNIDIVYRHKQEKQVVDFIPSEMQRILVNILANSLKYTRENKHIFITTDIQFRKLTIVVTDQGLGMTEEEQRHAFLPFYRAVGSSTTIGSGIGLSLVKLCVEAMDGTIDLKSTLGVGTTFTLTFDVRHDKEEVEAITSDAYQPVVTDQSEEPELVDGVGDEEQPTLLIVEDSVEMAHYTASQLAGDYRIYFATNGELGLKKATEIVPDLIITDVMMPGMSGLELCKLIRQSDLLRHIPIIIISAKATDESRIDGLKAGADAYLTKPFNREELRITVKNLLEQRERLRVKYVEALRAGTENDDKWPESDRKFIAEASAQVEQLMSERNINVNMLAEKLCMSSRQLQRRIMAVTGLTPSTFIMGMRIRHAKQQLLQGKSISEVALACGFEEASNFSRAFKRVTNMSPTQFVKEHQK
jgi:two-component system sensor histidine kinase ChiS